MGFYYVSSRYYDPEVGRFISADTTEVLTLNINRLSEKNLYSYCNNNPINCLDLEGYFPVAAWIIGEAVLEVGVSYLAAKLYDEEYTLADAGVTFATSVMSSVSPGMALICAAINGFNATNASLAEGYNLKTALTVGGITTIVSYCTMNNIVELMGYGLKGKASSFITASFGTGNTFMTEGFIDVVKDKSAKPAKNPGKKADQYYWSDIGYETPYYTIVKNGKLMR